MRNLPVVALLFIGLVRAADSVSFATELGALDRKNEAERQLEFTPTPTTLPTLLTKACGIKPKDFTSDERLFVVATGRT